MLPKYFILLLTVILICSCTSQTAKRKVYISTLYHTGNIYTREDSIKIQQIHAENKAEYERCERLHESCLLDGAPYTTEFIGGKGGITEFRRLLYENVKLPLHTKPGVYHINILVGRDNRIKNFSVVDKYDLRVKREIERVLQTKELNKWHSGGIQQYHFQWKFSIDYIIAVD